MQQKDVRSLRQKKRIDFLGIAKFMRSILVEKDERWFLSLEFCGAICRNYVPLPKEYFTKEHWFSVKLTLE